jgi:hypothetical protein
LRNFVSGKVGNVDMTINSWSAVNSANSKGKSISLRKKLKKEE